MSWSLVPLLHALVFACVAVLGRLVLAWRRLGALPLTLRTGDFARDFTARCFYVWLPLVDFVYLTIYAADGRPGPALWEGMLDSDGMRLAGVAMLVSGLVWVVYAQAAMGSNWRMGVDDAAQGALCTRGPFAYSRHPVYLGIRVTMLGQVLVIGSWPAFCLWTVEELLVQIQPRFEEAAMDARFGSKYQAYRASVRRWL